MEKSMANTAYEHKAQARSGVGKGAARELRRQGLVPAVIYGDKKEPLPIAIAYKDANHRIYGGGFLSHVITLDVDGEKHRVIPRDYQLDPVKDTPLHVDFLRVAAGQTIKVQVPVHVVGQESSPGLKSGGTMQIVEHTVEIDVAPESIPEFLEVSVAGLEVGDTLHSNDIKLPAGVSLTSRDNLTLVTILPPTVDAEPEAAEAEAAKA
jgi:large subunit ribosomal protein L25